MTVPFRAAALRVCAAFYGLAVAISLYPRFIRPAPPNQIPGFMTHVGLDAHAPFQFIATVIALVFLFAFALGPIAEALARDESRPWARITAGVAMLASLWTAMLVRDLMWVAIPPALAILTAAFLRRYRAGFTRWDTILIPTALALVIAITDRSNWALDRCVLVGVGATLALRLLVAAFGPLPARCAALAFSLAPLALLLESHLLGRNERYLGWPAIALIVLSPIVLRFALRTPRALRVTRQALAWVVFPVACLMYLSATSLWTAEGKVRVSVFEDAQHLVPAAEMMRGEHAYRDIIPPHGLGQDALVDYWILKRGATNVGQVIKARGVLSATNAFAQYAVAVAMTGSAPLGLATFFMAVLLGQGGGTLRIIPALFTLAIMINAVRKRRPRLLALAAAGVVLSFMTSLDFGVYSGLALLIAVWCFRGSRLRALREAVAGGAIAAVVVAIALAIAGILGDFLRVTFREVLTLGPVYALTPFDAPPAINTTHFIPDILATLLDRGAYSYLVWIASLVFFVVALTMRPRFASDRRQRRFDTFVVITAFIVACSISYAERHHLYFLFVVPELFAGAIVAFAHARTRVLRVAAPALTLLAIILGTPTTHLGIVSWLRHARGPVDHGLREVALPRARGAIFWAKDADTIESAHRYVESHLQPGETFFDFTNRGLFYYLFERDCPLRQIEVAFYEPEPLQREVIARLESNPRIRVAMVPISGEGTPGANSDLTGVDLVPNAERAPLVWQYLQEHFTPDFEEGSVAFWRRK